MLRTLNTILVVTLFTGLLVGLAISVRVGLRGVEHGIAENYTRTPAEQTTPEEAGAGFGHGFLRQP